MHTARSKPSSPMWSMTWKEPTTSALSRKPCMRKHIDPAGTFGSLLAKWSSGSQVSCTRHRLQAPGSIDMVIACSAGSGQ